ncbi:MAG TPA: alpha/beta hydrolase [Fulvivirga sp.]|nr:alpha/beta hydrolase [Fulvivirga sp.]
MKRILVLLLIFFTNTYCIGQVDIFDSVEDHYTTNNGVRIHYVTLGEGPVVLFVHGFPDFWYTWRDQMAVLATDYKVLAVDLRGYNLSDKPEGVENYTFNVLVQDLRAIILDNGERPVYLVAHDWGAAIAWRLAINYPQLIKKLVILSVPHPNAGDQISIPIESRKPSYVDRFVSEEFRNQLTTNWLAAWVTDPKAKERYREAFEKSDKDAMINYYKANASTLENLNSEEFLQRSKVKLANLTMPVLVIHGKNDPYLPISGHNNTWNFVDNELTIEVLPDAGHFIQRDESGKVTQLIKTFISN